MPKKSLCFKVSKRFGEQTLILTNKLGMINKELEIQRDLDFIYIPIIDQPSESDLKTLTKHVMISEISTRSFPERRKKETSFVSLLAEKLPSNSLASFPHSADFIGDIAIIEIPPELEAHGKIIGEAILKANKNMRTVLAKAGPVSGTYRLREFTLLAGEPKTETIHKEYGCQYYVNVAKAYFSPRLSNEHNRVASLVKEGETIIDMFAGVGPFAIQIAKKQENVRAYAIDVNPHAVEYLKRNVRLNRVEESVFPGLGDAKQIVKERHLGIADRVIMNLPEKATEFVDAACDALKQIGGIVHFYGFVNSSNTIEDLKLSFKKAVEKTGRKTEGNPFSRLVRATAPYEWQAVLDAEIY
jgi:tRNA (guanine37-N1)-methyltransferase